MKEYAKDKSMESITVTYYKLEVGKNYEKNESYGS